MKMSGKSNQIELSEEFMTMWREEKTFWDVMFPLYRQKNEKGKSLKRMSDFFRLIFSNKVLFRMQNLFSAYPEILKFQLCF